MEGIYYLYRKLNNEIFYIDSNFNYLFIIIKYLFVVIGWWIFDIFLIKEFFNKVKLYYESVFK